MDTYKTCALCKEDKALTDFHIMKTGKFGRQSRCKACTRLTRRNKLNGIPMPKTRTAKDTSLPRTERQKEYARRKAREYYERNKEKERERRRVAAKANPQKERERQKRWKEANREKFQARKARRRSRTKAAMNHSDKIKTWNYRKLLANRPCYYCGN